jgi:hypothetical protein
LRALVSDKGIVVIITITIPDFLLKFLILLLIIIINVLTHHIYYMYVVMWLINT